MDEINEKTASLGVRTGKQTVVIALKASKLTVNAIVKAIQQRHKDPLKHGKQTMKQLVKHDAALSHIPITNENLRSFDRIAKKYNIDYHIDKDKSTTPPTFYMYFKGKDVEVVEKALKEYAAKMLKQKEKPSIRQKLKKAKDKIKKQERSREKIKSKDRDISL